MGFGSLNRLILVFAFLTGIASANNLWHEGTEGTGSGRGATGGRGADGDQNNQNQQNSVQSAMQQFQQIQQANMALVQKKDSGRGASDSGNGLAEAAQKNQEALKTATDKQAEEFKKSSEGLFSSLGKSPSGDEIKGDVAKAFQQLSQPQPQGSIMALGNEVIKDIQTLNQIQVQTIAKIAEKFTAPPKPPVTVKPSPTVSTLAAPTLTASTTPGNIFSQALSLNSSASVPGHNNTPRMMTNDKQEVDAAVMRGLTSESLYNVPRGINLPK